MSHYIGFRRMLLFLAAFSFSIGLLAGQEILGIYVKKNGANVEGAKVCLKGATHDECGLTETGYISFGVAPGGYFVEVSQPETNPLPDLPDEFTLISDRLEVSPTGFFTFALPFVRLSGVVRDDAGRPMPGVVVNTHTHGNWSNFSGYVADETVSGPNGQYALNLMAGTYENLYALRPEWSQFVFSEYTDVAVSSNRTMDLVVSGGKWIEGTITVGGEPAAGATIEIESDTRSDAIARTDAQGTYFAYVEPGERRINAVIESSTMRLTASSTTTLSAQDQIYNLDFPVVTLSGVVRTDSNAPLANASVDIRTPQNIVRDGISYRAGGQLTTDASGRFEVEVIPGDYEIFVKPAQQGLPATPFEFAITENREVELVIPSDQAVRISGYVRDPQGNPVASLETSLQQTDFGISKVLQRTDANGYYEYQALAGEEYDLKFGKPTTPVGEPRLDLEGIPWSFYVSTTITPTQDQTINLELPLVVLHGIVTDEQGTPVPAAQVLTSIERDVQVDGFEGYVAGNATTDEFGRFDLALLAGTYERFHIATPMNVAGLEVIDFTITQSRTENFMLDGILELPQLREDGIEIFNWDPNQHFRAGDPILLTWAAEPAVAGRQVEIRLYRAAGDRDVLVKSLGVREVVDRSTHVNTVYLPPMPTGFGQIKIVSTVDPQVESDPIGFRVFSRGVHILYPQRGVIEASRLLPIHWRSDPQTAGTGLRFELWNTQGKVANLGYGWDPDGEGVTIVLVPNVPEGADYQIRAVSTWDDHYWDPSFLPLRIVSGSSTPFSPVTNSIPADQWRRYY